jgi:hypothetical protein
MRFTDGMFLLDQIFRAVYWGAFFILYEFTLWGDRHWMYCLLLAHIPGAMIWGYYEHRFGEEDHRFGEEDIESQKIGDEFKLGTPIKSVDKSDSLIIWDIPETQIT